MSLNLHVDANFEVFTLNVTILKLSNILLMNLSMEFWEYLQNMM